MVVYTAALLPDNMELLAAKAQGIPVWERSLMLGYVTGRYENCVCVSGTHGKTTAAALLTQILLGAGLNPAAVIGGKLPLIGGNGRAGDSELMVCEACEFKDTFLDLSPAISIILNIDADHLDYFGTLENIVASFRKFARITARALIVNGDDGNACKSVEGLEEEGKSVVTFGLQPHNTHYAQNIIHHPGVRCSFDWMSEGKRLCTVNLSIPGEHNICNALAALAAATMLGVSPETAALHAASFTGAGRRFEVLGERDSVTIVDDYAHHPAELTATLKTAKEMRFNRVWAVFQPFTYSRTSMFLDDFAEALSIADRVVMSEIMGAREVNTYDIYTKDLAAKIPGSVWFPTFEEIAGYVVANARPGDLVITLGCGDIYKAAKMMLAK
jgi:UDP-N-acetylmuramate--alanine ligase